VKSWFQSVLAFKFDLYRYAAVSDAAALNRLAKFASSEALLVVRGGAEAAASPRWVRAALVRMGADPAVAVVGVAHEGGSSRARRRLRAVTPAASLRALFGGGGGGGGGGSDPDPMKVMLVRRSALLDAGQIPGAPCDGGVGVGGFFRAWKQFLEAVRKRGGTTVMLAARAGGEDEDVPAAMAAAAAAAVVEKVKKREPPAACPAPTPGLGCRAPPAAAVLVQYYKREHNIGRLTGRAALTPGCQIGYSYMDHAGCHQLTRVLTAK
jgi:hypothetical protein